MFSVSLYISDGMKGKIGTALNLCGLISLLQQRVVEHLSTEMLTGLRQS